MNNLKTAKRSRMGKVLLRLMMTVCELGQECKDPSKILVEIIIEEWRAQSKRGRYKGLLGAKQAKLLSRMPPVRRQRRR